MRILVLGHAFNHLHSFGAFETPFLNSLHSWVRRRGRPVIARLGGWGQGVAWTCGEQRKMPAASVGGVGPVRLQRLRALSGPQGHPRPSLPSLPTEAGRPAQVHRADTQGALALAHQPQRLHLTGVPRGGTDRPLAAGRMLHWQVQALTAWPVCRLLSCGTEETPPLSWPCSRDSRDNLPSESAASVEPPQVWKRQGCAEKERCSEVGRGTAGGRG